MGSGFKDFAAGDILTAADVDGYLMRQTVMTFADASARDSALSGVLDEGMVAYLEDTNRTTFYDGSAWQDIANSSSIGTWSAYTPTVTSSAGTLTTTTTNRARFTRVNNIVTGQVDVTLNNIGTGSGSLNITLPVTASAVQRGVVMGREAAVTGEGINGELINTTTVALYRTSGNTMIVNNYRATFTIVYEVS